MIHLKNPLSLRGACSVLLVLAASCASPQADLGAPPTLELLNFRTLGPGVAGGGQVNVADFPTMAAAGYSLVVNLRRPGEGFPDNEAALARAAGMSYVAIPMGGDDLGTSQAELLADALEAHSDGHALIHCKSGNRVGAIWGLHVGLRDGLSAEEAVEAGRAGGMRSESLADCVRAALSPQTP